MKKKVTLNVEDFITMLNIYLAYKQFTQEEFGNLILTNRQAIAQLQKHGIENVSDGMLYRLYYYFSETVGEEKSDIEISLLNMIAEELNKRIEKQRPQAVKSTSRRRIRRRK